ncbi:hypothetical protein [Actinomyces sp. 565]|uniref:hypothetical protein n=1 Tax=Actinomyces sp. 565 TaxID=2057794 RepID=UPI0013A69A14|nr:hypothetical protein [Actinomyces sp. 565]NDR54111.1 hypothetical protein [Actinomyces sp. 565]
MSTTIDVYSTTDVFPLVHQTRARTEELFRELLARHGIDSTLDVTACYPRERGEELRMVPPDVRWTPGLEIGFGYWLNGVWDSNSWPECLVRDDDDLINEDDPDALAYPSFIGRWGLLPELAHRLAPETLDLIDARRHFWSEYRNAAGPAVASTGYGLAAAALAEATDGVIASFDSAFELEHNGETAEEFLSWWGDHQINFYGKKRFLRSHWENQS